MVCKRDTFVASSERMPRVGEVLLLWPVVVSKSGVRRRRRRQHRWTTSVAGATAGRGLVAAAATAARRRRLQVGRVVEPAVIDVEATRRRRTTRLFRLLGRMHAHRQTYTRPNIHTKTLHTTSRLHFLMHCCLTKILSQKENHNNADHLENAYWNCVCICVHLCVAEMHIQASAYTHWTDLLISTINIYAYNQSSVHICPSNQVISLFCPNNRWRIAQIVLIWSYTIKSRFWNRGRPNNCFVRTSYTKIRWNNAK